MVIRLVLARYPRVTREAVVAEAMRDASAFKRQLKQCANMRIWIIAPTDPGRVISKTERDPSLLRSFAELAWDDTHAKLGIPAPAFPFALPESFKAQ